MPNNIIKKVVKLTDLTTKKAEEKWDKAVEQAKKSGYELNYGYIMAIFKKMLGKERLSKLGWKSSFELVSVKISRSIISKLIANQFSHGSGSWNKISPNNYLKPNTEIIIMSGNGYKGIIIKTNKTLDQHNKPINTFTVKYLYKWEGLGNSKKWVELPKNKQKTATINYSFIGIK